MTKLLVTGLMILTFTACATPETRLRNGLVNAGLSQQMAACMADRMVDRLSYLQLKRIGSLGSLRDEKLNEIGLKKFLFKVRALQDPEILGVATSSAAICALS